MRSQRSTSAIGTAIVLFAVLGWALIANHNAPAFVGRENVRGAVVSIESFSSGSGGQVAAHSAFEFIDVSLPDGNVIRLQVATKRRVKIGDYIPIIQELYDDNSKMYLIDRQEWMIDSWE